jgi:predicted RNA-binding Zn-ribbon protein involved in translation (DUF1610 family)
MRNEGETVQEGEVEIKIERRYAIVQVTPEFLVALCKGNFIKRVFIEEHALPLDAEIVGTGIMNQGRQTHVFDASHGVVGILIKSASFEDVLPGLPIPILPAPRFKLIEEAPKGFESKCPACGELSLNSINEGPTMVKIECAKCGWTKYTRR